MKTIRVVAAVIKAVDEQGKEILFATQRGYGDMKGGWEFPGGKIEPGETPQEALKREIQEELDYPTFHLSMDCFLAEIESGNLVLKEHEAARWLTREELDSVDWLPADVLLIDTLKQSKLITPEKEV